MALVQMNFESQYLGNNHETSIILPDKPRGKTPKEFYESGEKYKVLWLLHGTFGDHSDWVRKSMIELYASEKNLIVVMPSALNSNFSNWPKFTIGYNWYDYLTEELMPLVHNWYPASSKREDNFIAGLSMGGEGAIKYAVNHPDKFAAAAVLSMAPRNFETIKEAPNGRAQNSIDNAGGYEAYFHSYENVWEKLRELSGKSVLPKLYFACGKEDFLYGMYGDFKKYAAEIGLDASFEEFEGFKHEWRFWDLSIQRALSFFRLDDKF
ncbi:MAG: esterase family protein [Christensenellaceae bacterium]|jgi:putative tributyrin esterase|nr:esterase family protein [Christensenellaceae bacterium]